MEGGAYTMTSEEISKEIIVAMIQQGLFDKTDKSTCSGKHEERAQSICQTFSRITKTVNDCRGGQFE